MDKCKYVILAAIFSTFLSVSAYSEEVKGPVKGKGENVVSEKTIASISEEAAKAGQIVMPKVSQPSAAQAVMQEPQGVQIPQINIPRVNVEYKDPVTGKYPSDMTVEERVEYDKRRRQPGQAINIPGNVPGAPANVPGISANFQNAPVNAPSTPAPSNFQGVANFQNASANAAALPKNIQGPAVNVPAIPPQGTPQPVKFMTDNVQFLSVTDKGPKNRVLTVKNKDGKTIEMNVPGHVVAIKFVDLAELKSGDDLKVDYLEYSDRNETVSIIAGKRPAGLAQMPAPSGAPATQNPAAQTPPAGDYSMGEEEKAMLEAKSAEESRNR